MRTKVQQITEINGVVLTEKASYTLKQMQDGDNRLLSMDIDELSETVCYLEKLFYTELDADSDAVTEGREHLQCLIEVRERLKTLKKP